MKRKAILQSALRLVLATLAIGLIVTAGSGTSAAAVLTQTGASSAPNVAVGTGFTYQGQLKQAGNPANGQFDFTFTLFDALSGGTQIGSTVTAPNQTVTNGLFTLPLDFGATAFQGDARWLEIAVRPTGGGTYTTLTPRQPLTAAPYAMSLVPGANILGNMAGTILTANNTGTGSALYGTATSGSGVYGLSTANLGHGVTGVGAGTNTVGVDGSATGPTGSQIGVRGTSANGYGVAGYATAAGNGVYGSSFSGAAVFGTSSGASSAGVYGTNTANLGKGVVGVGAGTNTVGVDGSATGPTGSQIGVRGTSANGYGVAGYATASGYGVYGISTNYYGVYGTGSSNSAGGVYGVSTASIGGAGVTGSASASAGVGVLGSGGTGVWGNSNSGNGVAGYSGSGDGVYGLGVNGVHGVGADGTSSENGILGTSNLYSTGVNGAATYGIGVNGTTLTGYAVYGHPLVFTGYAGYFDGNVTVTGSCCAMAEGTTQIDNPTDPANKYLNQSLVQSADMLSIINGNAVLDNNGEAIVTVPDWFQAANGSFRYTLTAVIAPGPNLYISGKLQNSQFKISGGKAGGEVSWEVSGVRTDPYALAHPLTNAAAKSTADQGKYLHPTELGQPASKGINYEQEQKDQQLHDNLAKK